MHRNILIATDGSRLSNKALDYALRLAADVQASVVILHTSESVPLLVETTGAVNLSFRSVYKKTVAKEAQEILKKAEEKAQNRALFCITKYLPNTVPAMGIVETAKKHKCDLIVMGSHGRTGIKKLFLGSQAMAVLTHSKIPVLIVR